MSDLEYVTEGVYGNTEKYQLHLDVPYMLQRARLSDTPRHRRIVIRQAFAELRGYGIHEGGCVLIARQAGVVRQ